MSEVKGVDFGLFFEVLAYLKNVGSASPVDNLFRSGGHTNVKNI